MIDLLFEPFVLRAGIAGIGVAVAAGSIGCFVVWRKMAYFGDSLAHSALLGVALGIVSGLSANIGIVIVCSLFAALLIWLQQKRILATDTLLGILAHGALSVGMVVLSIIQPVGSFSLHAYLFGDILAVGIDEIVWIFAGGLVVVILLIHYWSSLVLMTIHEDLARAENVRVFWMQLLLMFIMTVVFAVSVRIVGILLVTSMLIIPAACARTLARSPEMMAILASCFGVCAVVLGIIFAAALDTPLGPSIVSMSVLLFIMVLPMSSLKSH